MNFSLVEIHLALLAQFSLIAEFFIASSRGGLVSKGVNQIQVDWTLQAVVQIPLWACLYGTVMDPLYLCPGCVICSYASSKAAQFTDILCLCFFTNLLSFSTHNAVYMHVNKTPVKMNYTVNQHFNEMIYDRMKCMYNTTNGPTRLPMSSS